MGELLGRSRYHPDPGAGGKGEAAVHDGDALEEVVGDEQVAIQVGYRNRSL